MNLSFTNLDIIINIIRIFIIIIIIIIGSVLLVLV